MLGRLASPKAPTLFAQGSQAVKMGGRRFLGHVPAPFLLNATSRRSEFPKCNHCTPLFQAFDKGNGAALSHLRFAIKKRKPRKAPPPYVALLCNANPGKTHAKARGHPAGIAGAPPCCYVVSCSPYGMRPSAPCHWPKPKAAPAQRTARAARLRRAAHRHRIHRQFSGHRPACAATPLRQTATVTR
jgi:hypothetical protein